AGNFTHRANGDFENFITLHFEEVISAGNRFSSEATLRPAARGVELLFVTTVGSNPGRENSAALLNWSEDRRTRTITEKNARRTIGVIDVPRQKLGANDE